MKVYILFFIFLMINTMTAEKAMTKLLRKLIVPKLDDKCRKIKCASVDEPECVKMKRKDLGSDVHIIVVNKCELDYLKCHDDVEAKIVPMKFCSHNRRNSGKKIMKEKSHLRVKRRVFQRSRKDNNEENDLFKGIDKLHKNGTINTKSITSKPAIWKNESSNIIPKETIKKVNSTENIHREGDVISSQIEDDPENKIIHDEVVEKVADAEHLKYQQRKRKIKYLEVPLPLFSNENDLDETVKEPNLSEYNAVCPTVCPSRNVMVCARCQHGVYRSFISVCHMRMFDCNHDDEELELVSRNSCLLSAPYLSEDDMKPQGKVVEANDDDKILRYIICKQNKEIHGRYNKGLSIITRVSVSVSFNQSSEYALRDYHHELKSVEIEEELKDDDDDVAHSEEINRAEDKMLANNKFVVKFKHKNLNNDKVTLNETLTPMNNYKSIYTSYANHITNESSKETNEINTLDKNDMKKLKFVKDLLKEDNDYKDTHPKDTAELVKVKKKIKKKVAKKPTVIRNQDMVQHKNLKLYKYLIKTLFPRKTLKIKPQSYGDIIYKRVPNKKIGQESKKNPIKSEIMEDMIRQKLKEYYKNKLKGKKMAKQTPSDTVKTDMLKNDKVEKHKSQKHRKNKQNSKNILKNKIKKEISRMKHGNQKKERGALRNDEYNNNILSYNNNPYEKVTKYISYNKTTHKVKKIHTSPNVASYKLKHEGKGEFDSGELRSKKWESSEEIEPYDLARINNEKNGLNSSEELSREDAGENSPRLPFYLSSTLATKRLTFKKRHTKKYKGDLTSTFVHLDEVKRTPSLRYNEDAGVKQKNVYKNHNIDINAKLDKWSSSKMIDLLTEKVAAKMLKKLDESLYAKGLRTLEKAGYDNEKVEQIEILFNNYGEMEIRRKGEDNFNGRTIYFDTHNARRRI